jgi:hypothetical protein
MIMNSHNSLHPEETCPSFVMQAFGLLLRMKAGRIVNCIAYKT